MLRARTDRWHHASYWARLLAGAVLGLVLLTPAGARAQGESPMQDTTRFRYADAPLRSVIEDVEARTPYRFLYRDALIAGVAVTFDAGPGEVGAALQLALRGSGVEARVDAERHQILIMKAARKPSKPWRIQGYVLDAATGMRLPMATVTWRQEGMLRGVAADASGAFTIAFRRGDGPDLPLALTVSHLGYASQTVVIDPADPPGDWSIRLAPQDTEVPGVIVQSSTLGSDVDTTWQALIQPSLFSSMGESSVLRSLQPLPAVSITGALSSGLTVRGSRSDGFLVLLDDMTIYNQSHLFGLFDALNDDVLQTAGLYYGVVPAQYPAPPGGLLSFHTRTGAQTEHRGTVGMSSTAVEATAEGPLAGGRGSWLLSGRHSYLDAVHWLNNPQLVAQGLDVDRPTSPLPENTTALDERVFTPGIPSARFFDAHGKLFYETAAGRRLTLSAYVGGDDTEQGGERLMRPAGEGGLSDLAPQAVHTENEWGNQGVSVQAAQALGSRVYMRTTVAGSRYYSQFSKDDFLYTIPQRGGEVRYRYGAFTHANDLAEVKWQQQVDVSTGAASSVQAGYALHLYDVRYEEESLPLPAFVQDQRTLRADVFGEYERRASAWTARWGARLHYFSADGRVRVSPRMQLRLWPEQPISVGAGYTHTYQFMHRISLVNDNSADTWISSTRDQPPGSIDHVMAGVYARPFATTTVQVEGYYKHHRNVRQHESVLGLRRGDVESLLLFPWIYDNTATARGLEVMHRQQIGALDWTNSYTLASVELQNDDLNRGQAFPADWDRCHQYATRLQATLTPRWTAYTTWFVATGTPNALRDTRPREPERLDLYHRLDAGVQYQGRIGHTRTRVRLTAYNMYDKDNTWYRNAVGVVRQLPFRRTLGFETVDVYDLGFQPAFEVSIQF